jgi:superfamily II DNA or RNA helicase
MREIDLRPYQVDAVEKLRAGIRNGLRRQILVAPTAFGKTECAAHIIQQSQLKGSTSWFIVDRITLIDQTSERFASYGIDHGIIQADHWLTDSRKSVQIVSAQTLINRPTLPFPDLIVHDEAHCQFLKILEMMAAARSKVIGLTATPFTAGMADHWDGIVNGATVNQLLKLGFLTPLKIKACVTPDMKGAKKKFTGEYEDEEAGQRGITIIGDVVQTWVQQTAKFFGGPVKTIVFSPSVKHGEELCRQFAEAGYNFQQISYLDASDNDRRAKIEEFRKPDSAIHGLVSCAVLTKGFDVPDVLCGISCRPYAKSFSSHIQELGRVMRIAPGKEFGLWLDHTGNCISFADDTAWLFEHGVDSLSDAQKKDSETREPVERVKQKYFCGGCGLQMGAGDPTCLACGWERPKRGEIQTVEGELIDFEVSMRSAYQPRKGLRAECLRNPRAIWNAALAYCFEHSRKDPESVRKWAFRIWKGVYPDSKLPHGLWDARPDIRTVTADEQSLVEREVRRWRNANRQVRRAA